MAGRIGDNDPRYIAQLLLRKQRALNCGTDFDRPLVYQDIGIA